MLWLNMMIMTMAMMMMMLMMIMTSKGVVQLTKWLPTYWCTIRVPWAAVEGKQQAKSTNEDGLGIVYMRAAIIIMMTITMMDYAGHVPWAAAVEEETGQEYKWRWGWNVIMMTAWQMQIMSSKKATVLTRSTGYSSCLSLVVLTCYLYISNLSYQNGWFLGKFQTACDFKLCNPKMQVVTPWWIDRRSL